MIDLLYDKYSPDLVFSTIVINDAFDVPILREAKKRNIRTVGAIRSWDSFHLPLPGLHRGHGYSSGFDQA